jgi:hypothetical protein
MPIWNRRQIMLAGLLLVCMLAGIRALAQAPDSCQSVYFKVTLNAHDDYQRELGGGLLFRVTSQKDPAWFVDIVPAEENTKDYIYPVNLPLQLNGNQTLGPGYGETVKSSLSHPHEMNFLLDRSDYQRISGLVSNVLHSYQTSDPDRALSDYSNAVDDARKGWLRVRIASYKTASKAGALTRIKLRVEITTPADFQFAPGVYPWPTPCHR